MTTLGTLILSLILVTLAARKRPRHEEARLMRPADEWSAEDLDCWLDLIEPFPLDSTAKRR
ncbi:MAG: hypothetical protein V3T86_16235 [Planctomycetota bacterium]